MRDAGSYFPLQFKVVNKWSKEMTYIPAEKDKNTKYVQGFPTGDHFTIESSDCKVENINGRYYLKLSWVLKGVFMTDGKITHRDDKDILDYSFKKQDK